MTEVKVFEKICPICGKKIISLNEKQMEYNFNLHYISCKEKNNKENSEGENGEEI